MATMQDNMSPQLSVNVSHERSRNCARRAVIHQPYFLPWLGYFSKLAFCDLFVILDNVHYTKQHYLDRTRIVNMHGEIAWLSLPTGQNLGRDISQVKLRPPDTSYFSRLIQTVQASYAKALRFESEWPFVKTILTSSLETSPNLLEVNLNLLQGVALHLGIPLPQIVLASTFSSARDATTRLTEVCAVLGITTLVVGGGRSQAVHDMRRLQSTGVQILTQDYLALHPQYSQSRRRYANFVPGLSILDALFNVGADSVRKFVSAPWYTPVPIDSLSTVLIPYTPY